MSKPVGGRGKKAPYQTIQVRVPLPIKAQVEQLIERYREQVLEESHSTKRLVEPSIKPVFEFSELETIVQEVLSDPVVTRNGRDKGSVKRALDGLVTRMYEKSLAKKI